MASGQQGYLGRGLSGLSGLTSGAVVAAAARRERARDPRVSRRSPQKLPRAPSRRRDEGARTPRRTSLAGGSAYRAAIEAARKLDYPSSGRTSRSGSADVTSNGADTIPTTIPTASGPASYLSIATRSLGSSSRTHALRSRCCRTAPFAWTSRHKRHGVRHSKLSSRARDQARCVVPSRAARCARRCRVSRRACGAPRGRNLRQRSSTKSRPTNGSRSQVHPQTSATMSLSLNSSFDWRNSTTRSRRPSRLTSCQRTFRGP